MNKIKTVLLLVTCLLSLPVGKSILGISTLTADPQEVQCLATNIYHESRGEPIEGQVAVALVTINRVASQTYKNTLCEVVYEPRQFSWTLDKRKRVRDLKAWQTAKTIAESVLTNPHRYTKFDALYFHTKQVKPKWAKSKRVVAVIGNHIFYN